MKMRQKLGLAAFLCLSVFIIVVALIRVTGFYYHHVYDDTWLILWSQLEACVAVTMISLTAFRSLYVANVSKLRKKRTNLRQATVGRAFRRQAKTPPDDKVLAGLTIPSATLVGSGMAKHGSVPESIELEEETIVPDHGSQEGQSHFKYGHEYLSTV